MNIKDVYGYFWLNNRQVACLAQPNRLIVFLHSALLIPSGELWKAACLDAADGFLQKHGLKLVKHFLENMPEGKPKVPPAANSITVGEAPNVAHQSIVPPARMSPYWNAFVVARNDGEAFDPMQDATLASLRQSEQVQVAGPVFETDNFPGEIPTYAGLVDLEITPQMDHSCFDHHFEARGWTAISKLGAEYARFWTLRVPDGLGAGLNQRIIEIQKMEGIDAVAPRLHRPQH